MKRLAILLIAIALSSSSCVTIIPFFNGLAGDGDIVITPLNLNSFTEVDNRSSADIFISKGSSYSVTLTVDRNILDVLDIRVEGDELIVDIKPGYSIYRTTEFRLDIEMPALEKASIAGSGEMRILDSFTGDRLVLSIAGSGDMTGSFEYEEIKATIAGSGNITMNTMVEEMECRIVGSGDIELEGEADILTSAITGSGNIRAKDFECEDVELNIAGSGSAIVSVEDTLDVVITGSGSVYYYGRPYIHYTDTGSGSIQNWGS